MSIFETVDKSIREAMLARDKTRLEALRGVKKEFIEAKTAPGSNGELTDEQAVKIMTRMVKQRKESARIYAEQSRKDLADGELAEVAVIQEFLPKAMSDEEVEAAVMEIIARLGVTDMKGMGRVMGTATKELAGKAEGGKISAIVKKLLS